MNRFMFTLKPLKSSLICGIVHTFGIQKFSTLALLKTISGFRGTIGGEQGKNLTPVDIVSCSAAYAHWLKQTKDQPTVVVGRDGRMSGEMVSRLSIETLRAMGVHVLDAGLSTTPTIEIAVVDAKADGGIIYTASHNPKEWNALKFLNAHGEFISKAEGAFILEAESKADFNFVDVESIGHYRPYNNAIQKHIDQILELKILDPALIRSKSFHVVVDCINSTASISIPPLLDKLGCSYSLINQEMTGEFAHNPEPLPSHLSELSETVIKEKAHLGIAVDPDVDRLAFMSENGHFFGEEYTLVAIADFILSKTPGSTVSNLSSSRALFDISKRYGQAYHAAAVGEVNVVSKMKAVNAVIGGEGNGGVIFPELHYGRDALVGIAFILQLVAEREIALSELKDTYPNYEIRKHKIDLIEGLDVDAIYQQLELKYASEQINRIDGLKIDLDSGWVHLRKSNTEAILRVYSESSSAEEADQLAEMIINDVRNFIKNANRNPR